MEYAGRSSPPQFLVKTYMMVEDPTTNGIVSWNINGTTFVVWRPAEFARDLLPTIFKHDNFASFVRQLNTYGFHKVSSEHWEFGNYLFRRGAIHQLRDICRKKGKHKLQNQPPPSSSKLTILVDENKRLERENGDLSSELVVVKNKFKKLLDLAVDCTKSSERQESDSNGIKKIVNLEGRENRGEHD